MKYSEFVKNTIDDYAERLELVMERIREMAAEPGVPAPFDGYFREAAAYQLKQYQISQAVGTDAFDGIASNDALYSPFAGEAYEKSYCNHTYAVSQLGEYGNLLAAVFYRMTLNNRQILHGAIQKLCIYAELLVELNCYFAEPEFLSYKEVRDAVRSFMHDYAELFTEDNLYELLDPDYTADLEMICSADLSDPAYLYRYGLYVGSDELATARKLASMPEKELQAMADTMTEGYRIGFAVCSKDISKKKHAQIRYYLGFEQIVKRAAENFAKMGLRTILFPTSESVNKQMDFDHKEDRALWDDKEFTEYEITCYRNTLEELKDIAPLYGGPDVIEIFGEAPYTPETRQDNPKLDEKQQKLAVYRRSSCSQLLNKAIHGEERSFSVIAYPVASIGKDYDEIFAETVKLNTLDYNLYRDMQQKLIDALDQADRVHIKGCGINRTDLYVKVWDLQDPQKQTAFENCVADVNIPVGEVFTSPVLKGTEGKLFVSQVFLQDYSFENLEIDFADGMISAYNCTNFDEEEKNRRYIEENILFHHPSLPMGEFAIGTNTTAYRMGREYGIQDRLPILIAEKTGPHFAVGDTCFSYDEDNLTYNPDGKAMVARENDISRQRHTDFSKAYFNCHTDITIPYDELEAITVIRHDGSTIDIIRDGRFVLPGTEPLNEPLN